jgi:hypothetical protein
MRTPFQTLLSPKTTVCQVHAPYTSSSVCKILTARKCAEQTSSLGLGVWGFWNDQDHAVDRGGADASGVTVADDSNAMCLNGSQE